MRDEEGQPIKGAVVTADNRENGNTATATTDDRGRFTMIGLRPGNWRFVAYTPDIWRMVATCPFEPPERSTRP